MRLRGEQHPGVRQVSGGRRTIAALVVRYLVGRSAIDHVKRTFTMAWLVGLAGMVLLFVGPRWLGGAVLALAVLAFVVRAVLVKAIERLSMPRQYRGIEDEFSGAVEAGKPNIRRELERVGLPSSRWRMPLFALRMARRSGREALARRLGQIDLEQVLPQVQIERAARLIERAHPQH